MSNYINTDFVVELEDYLRDFDISDLRQWAEEAGLNVEAFRGDRKRLTHKAVCEIMALHVNARALRDVIDEAGYIFPNVPSDHQVKPDPAPIGEIAAAESDHSCPKCGSEMIKRVARRGHRSGREFWGCSNFPKCRGVRNISGDAEVSQTDAEEATASDAPPVSFDAEAMLSECPDLTEIFGSKQAAALNHIAELAVKAAKTAAEAATASLNQSEGYTPRFELVEASGETREVEGIVPECFDRILQLAQARKPIMLTGPTGCGKTHVAGMVAESLKLPHYAIPFNEGVSENVLQGWLLPIGKDGRFVHVAPEALNIIENGGVLTLDEGDSADANMLLLANSLVANGYIAVPQRHENPIAYAHKDLIVIMCANTFGQGADIEYSARNKLDEATLDRFRAGLVEMDYDQNVESQLIDPTILKWALPIRKRVKTLGLHRNVSTRFLRDLTDMKEMFGWTRKDWENQLFAGWSEDEKRRVAA